jgi:tRNA pseudouridine55 synthase
VSTSPPAGLLVVDKPPGYTSHDVVAVVRRRASTRKVGHAGTLDPAATGVLVLGVSRGTRLLGFLVGADKDYDAVVRLGEATTTDDAQGDVVSRARACDLRDDDVRAAMGGLTGDIVQVPSTVSAIKVDGRPAHARVRAGEEVVLTPRPVHVAAFDLLARAEAASAGSGVVDLRVHVSCSSGTYVRALARDLGAALGVGGHVRELRRTRVGPFTLADATPLDDVPEGLAPALLPLGQAVSRFLPCRVLDAGEAGGVGHGVPPPATGRPGPVALLDGSGALLAVAEDRGPRAALTAVFVG